MTSHSCTHSGSLHSTAKKRTPSHWLRFGNWTAIVILSTSFSKLLFSLFLIQTQISSSTDTTHLRFPSYALHSSFLPEIDDCQFVQQQTITSRLYNHNCPNREFQLVWISALVLRTVLRTTAISYLRTLSVCLQQTATPMASSYKKFNAYIRKRLIHLPGTSDLESEAEHFAVTNSLRQPVDFRTRTLNSVDEHAQASFYS